MLNTRYKKLLAATAIATALVGGYWWYVKPKMPTAVAASTTESGILPYNEEQDKKDILTRFIQDRYWLLSSDDYDAEFMLDYKAPNKNPLYVGKLHVNVLREDGKFAGFTAYYKKTMHEGALLFLDVSDEFRGKKYGEKLARFAIDELVKMGATTVSLWTRVDNLRAQGLYKKLGFVETYRDDGFMVLTKKDIAACLR